MVTTTQDGDILDAATWGGALPAVSDDVTIAHACFIGGGTAAAYAFEAVTITINADAILVVKGNTGTTGSTVTLACATLTINGSAGNTLGRIETGPVQVSGQAWALNTVIAANVVITGGDGTSGAGYGSGVVMRGYSSGVGTANAQKNNLVINGNVDCHSTGGANCITTLDTAYGRTLTINGTVTVDSYCSGVERGSVYFDVVTFNSPHAYNPALPSTVAIRVAGSGTTPNGGTGFTAAVYTSWTVNGDIVNDYVSEIGASYSMFGVYDVSHKPGVVNGNLLVHGDGWALRHLSTGTVTVNGTNHVMDHSAGGSNKSGADLLDVGGGGTLNVYGDVAGSDNDVTCFCRLGTLNVHGNVRHTQSGETLCRAIVVQAGTCSIHGHVFVTGGGTVATSIEVAVATGKVGALVVYGDILSSGASTNVLVTAAGTGTATLTTYGALTCSGFSNATANGQWNHVGYVPAAIAAPGNNTKIDDQTGPTEMGFGFV